jgi:hypothetical protein
MTSFLVVRIEGDVPDSVARVAYESAGGVLRAWNVIQPDTDKRVDVELLLETEEPGKQRQRHSHLSRLYAEGWDSE